jgi:uncharacterized protein (DUF1330 family)
MEENKTFLVITAIVNKQNIAEVPEYLGSVMQIFGQNGGKPVGRYKTVNALVGEESPEMIAIISFENSETVKKMLEGYEYKSLSKLRERVFNDLKIVLCTELN